MSNTKPHSLTPAEWETVTRALDETARQWGSGNAALLILLAALLRAESRDEETCHDDE